VEDFIEAGVVCPVCGSSRVSQRDYDPSELREWYQCSDCGTWYDEEGNVDTWEE